MRPKNCSRWPQFRNHPRTQRKRAGVAKSVSNHWIGAFPTIMPRNIFFACLQKNNSHRVAFRNCPRTRRKRAGVGKSVANHRIGAFLTKMPRNLFSHACEKTAPKERTLERKRKCAGVANSVAQPSNWGIPHHNAEKYFFRMSAKKPLPRSGP